MIATWKGAAAGILGLIAATGAATASAERVAKPASRAYVEVTISQNQGNMPWEGIELAMNQNCQVYLYILKDGVAQDVWNDWDVYWSSRMGDLIHEYPHSYTSPNQNGYDQMHVYVVDKRDGSTGASTAQFNVTPTPQVWCFG